MPVSGKPFRILRTRRSRASSFRSRQPRLEALESRQMMAADWQNPVNALDVDGNDGPYSVTPLDPLLVINELTYRQNSNRDTGALRLLEPGTQPPPYLDVDGNGFLSPLDALIVINALPTTTVEDTGDSGLPDRLLAGTRAAWARGSKSTIRVQRSKACIDRKAVDTIPRRARARRAGSRVGRALQTAKIA